MILWDKKTEGVKRLHGSTHRYWMESYMLNDLSALSVSAT